MLSLLPECIAYHREKPGKDRHYSRLSSQRVKILLTMKSFLEEVQKRWFLLGIVAVITLAKLGPFLGAKGGA
jgi:hypothetical protein